MIINNSNLRSEIENISNFGHLNANLNESNLKNSEYPIFDGSIKVKSKNNVFLRDYLAVYFFHDLRGIHYIGETMNLKKRYLQHLEKEKNRKLIEALTCPFGVMNFSWVKVLSKMEALKLQKKWVRLFKPQCNEIQFSTIT